MDALRQIHWSEPGPGVDAPHVLRDVRFAREKFASLATMVGSQVHFFGRAEEVRHAAGDEAPVLRVAGVDGVCMGFLKVVPLTERWTQQQSSAAARTSSAASAFIVLPWLSAASIDAFRRLVVSGDDADAVTNQCAPQRACDGGQPIAMLFVWSLLWMVIRLILKW